MVNRVRNLISWVKLVELVLKRKRKRKEEEETLDSMKWFVNESLGWSD